MEESKTSKKLVNSALLVILVTVIAKVFGFAREVVMGSVFGTGDDSNIYFWALGITTTIYMAIATAVSSSMLPTLKECKVNGEKERSQKYFNKITTLVIGISVLITIVLVLTAPYYVSMIAEKYQEDSLRKAILITQILTPSLVFIMLAYITKTILQAEEKFFIYSIISLPYNVLLLVYLVFFSKQYGIYGLSVCTTIAWLLQLLIQIPSLIKLKTKYKIDFKVKDEDIKKFGVLILPLLISTLVYSINTLVDKSIALNLTSGKVSGLSYGYTVYSSIATTIILGITTVLYPKFIETKIVSSNERFKEQISRIISAMIYVGMPLMICFITLNKEIIEIVYMRGNFDATSVELTRNALIFYSLGALGYTIQDVLMKVYYSLNESKIPMITSIISVVINIVLDFIFVKYFDYWGLAFATTIAICVNALIMFICLEKKIGRLHKKMLFKTFMKCFLALIPGIILTRVIIDNFYTLDANLIMKIALVVGSTVISGIIYLFITYLLKLEETKFIISNYLTHEKVKNKSQKTK